jgi:hypothetical protein
MCQNISWFYTLDSLFWEYALAKEKSVIMHWVETSAAIYRYISRK